MDGEDLQREAVELLRIIRAGADPLGTLKRILALAERTEFSLSSPQIREWALLAGASKGLWDSTLRHPEWINGKGIENADPRVVVQERLVEIARQDLIGNWPLDRVAAEVSGTADEAAELALALATKRFRERSPGKEPPLFAVSRPRQMGGAGAQLCLRHRPRVRRRARRRGSAPGSPARHELHRPARDANV